MRLVFTFLLTIMTCVVVFSQQPFKDYGYKVKIGTLSKGEYNEFFDQDSLIQIGSVVMNQGGKIVAFVVVDTVYSEATLEPELISRWLSPDPLSEKYFSFSPYNFVLNNPIRFVDPDGTTVRPADEKAVDAIKNTLSEKEAKYVKLDRNGNIKERRLERGARKLGGGSDNFKALKTLASSDRTYNVSVSQEYKTKDADGNVVTGDLGAMTQNPENGKWNGSFGVTLTPDNPSGEDLSPDQNVHIVINPTAPGDEQTKTTAHEAFGHAYFYELNKQGQDVNPYHAYELTGDVVNGEITMSYSDTNTGLKDQIRKVENLAVKNYEQRKPKRKK